MSLLERMKVSIDTMTMGERFLGSMQVTLLGMGIVFMGLATLYFSIVIMQKVLNKSTPDKVIQPKHDSVVEEDVIEETVDDTELVAVITAAVAANLNTSTHNIIVRNITRISDQTPSWAQMGRVDQISNKL